MSGWRVCTYAMTWRRRCPCERDCPGWTLVVAEGHVREAHGIRFYAADSDQAGLLARQQEIEHLQRDIKAQQLIADQAIAAVARAETAWQQASQSMGPARLRVTEITRRLH